MVNRAITIEGLGEESGLSAEISDAKLYIGVDLGEPQTIEKLSIDEAKQLANWILSSINPKTGDSE